MKLEQRARLYGVIGTILFLIVLFILLWTLTLSRAVPEEEEGLAVSIGVDAEGGDGFFEPSPADEIEGMFSDDVSDADVLSEAEEEFQTQDLEESLAMNPQKSEEELKREQEQRERERQKELERQEQLRKEAEAKALKEAQDKKAEEIGNRTKNIFGGDGSGGAGNSNTSTGQGTGNSTGSQGNPFGQQGGNPTGTGAGASGNSYSLAGRSLVGELIKPSYNVSEEGKIVVTIIVDKDGSVINASVGSGTNIDNPTLRKAATEAARKTKFNKITTDKNQSGTITYNFKLQ